MKLQNNYTTPEQSQRLLDLGVPRYSADCYYGQRKTWTEPQPMIIGDSGTQYKVNTRNDIIPCWSVGRLIEIYEICTPYVFTGFYNYIGTNTEAMIKIYESVICHPVKNFMDFSKLED